MVLVLAFGFFRKNKREERTLGIGLQKLSGNFFAVFFFFSFFLFFFFFKKKKVRP